MHKHFSIYLLVALLTVACKEREGAHSQEEKTYVLMASPPKSEIEAGLIATNLAQRNGMKLERYDLDSVSFDEEKREWHFFYTLKPPGMPGGHFSVIIQQNGTARLFPGA